MKQPKPALYRKFMSQFIGKPCAKCGVFHESNVGHHIHYKSKSGYMVLVFLNLMPLCLKCHAEAHNNKLVFFDWLDDNYTGRLEKLNEIRIGLTNARLSHEEIYEEYGRENS